MVGIARFFGFKIGSSLTICAETVDSMGTESPAETFLALRLAAADIDIDIAALENMGTGGGASIFFGAAIIRIAGLDGPAAEIGICC